MNDKRNDRRKATKFDKRSMLAAATNAFGDIKDWQPDDLKSASSLVMMMKPRDLKELDTAVVSVQRITLSWTCCRFLQDIIYIFASPCNSADGCTKLLITFLITVL